MSAANFPFDPTRRPAIAGYGVAVLTVAAALICTLQMEARWQSSSPVAMLLLAVIVTTRLGGPRPAVLAAALSLVGFGYFVLPLDGPRINETIQAVRLLSLALVTGYVVWVTITEQGAAHSLRRAHDDLRRNNEALRRENLERRQTEEQLRASETKFRALAESAPAAILIYQDGRICYANPAASAITGYSSAELCDMERLRNEAPSLSELLRERGIPQQPDGRTPLSDELRFVAKSGDERWLGFTAAAFEFEGKPATLLVACDVTERRRAEEALLASQQLLNLVLETLPVGVAVTDRSGDVVLSNAASRRIWGESLIRSGDERWARSVGYWHGSGRRIAPTEWPSVRALRDGSTTLNELIDIEAFDGRRKTIQASAAPARNAEATIEGAVFVLDEVTERVSAEKALQDSASHLQQLSRRLLAVQEEERRHLSRELHDEFGQLITSVTLHLSAARNEAAGAVRAKLEESIALLQRAGAQLRSLVLELRPTMLESAGLTATLRWLAEQYRERSDLIVEVAGDTGEVPAHVAIVCFRVAQEALTNIARHAQARHVWIELREHGGHLELEVRDDGAGFDVARTLEQAADRGHLGLLGMRERVQIAGGDLVIDSAPGRGTRISVALPPAGPPTHT